MPKADSMQWSFAGGEWAQDYQGRIDDELYGSSLNVSLNGYPIKTGAWTRRQGTRWAGFTRAGAPAKIVPFTTKNFGVLQLEFTDNVMRAWQQTNIVFTKDEVGVTSLSTATPAVLTTTDDHNWVTGNQVAFLDGDPLLRNRTFHITVTGNTTFTLVDDVTGEDLVGAGLEAPTTVYRVLEIANEMTGTLRENAELVQATTESAALLTGRALQQVEAIDAGDGELPDLSISPLQLQDGPYLEVIKNATLSPDATDGVIGVSIAFAVFSATKVYDRGAFVQDVNLFYRSLVDSNVGNTPASSPSEWEQVASDIVFGPNGVSELDIGRLIRMHSEPDEWALGTAYTTGQRVKYAGTYWAALRATTGDEPSASPLDWVISLEGAHRWTWGRIAGVQSFIDNALAGSTGIGDLTLGGGIAAGRDKIIAQLAAASAGGTANSQTWSTLTATTVNGAGGPIKEGSATATKYIGTNFTGATPQKVSSATVFPSSDLGFVQWRPSGTLLRRKTEGVGIPTGNTNTPRFTGTLLARLRAKNGSAPANSSDGTLLGATSFSGLYTSVHTHQLIGLDDFGRPKWSTQRFSGAAIPIPGMPAAPFSIPSNDPDTSWDYVWVEMVWTVSFADSDGWIRHPVTNAAPFYALDIYVSEIRFLQPFTDGAAGLSVEVLGQPLLATNSISEWRLGVYADSTAWPTLGTYHEGRLWLTGAVGNRFDTSRSNDPYNFAPTENDGTVTPSNGISYTFNTKEASDIFWMESTERGVIAGTKSGEWLIAPATPGAISPTNIDAKPVTRVQCADVPPVRTEHSLLFVEQAAESMYEHFLDVNAAVYSTKDVALRAPHLVFNIVDTAYIAEPVPMVLARRFDGTMTGLIYKRTYLSAAREPELCAWYDYQLPEGHSVADLSVGEIELNRPAIAMIVSDPNGIHSLEYSVPRQRTFEGWFLDRAIAPIAAEIVGSAVRLHGFSHLEGLTVTVVVNKLDCGDFTVTDGYVDVPFGNGVSGGTGRGQFTPEFWEAAAITRTLVGLLPNVRGQRLRPLTQQETGTRQGLTSFAKERRVHETAFMVKDTRGLNIGTRFDDMKPLPLTLPDDRTGGPLTLYSGIFKEAIDDESGFDGMVAWEIPRPDPVLIQAVATFQKTQE